MEILGKVLKLSVFGKIRVCVDFGGVMRSDLKFARKMKVKQAQVERPAQADLTETGKISPTRTQGTGPRPSVKEKVKPARF